MTKKRIGLYLLFSFGLTWGVMIPYFLLGGKYESPTISFILAFSMLCPTIAVVITRKITGEGFRMTGKASLMLGIDLKNKKWIWFLLALIGPILYWDLGELLFYAIFPQAFDPSVLDTLGIPRNYLFLIPLSGISSSFLISFGALGEEIGWRSYLYPKLEELYGTKKAILFGGIIWGVWHYPGICAGHSFGHGYFGEPWTGFLVFTIYTIAMGTILFYLTKKTGSVWAAAFLHAANNTFSGSTVLGLTYSDEKLTGIALQSPLRLFIISIPVLLVAALICF
ncbi:MAG: lysostaphin resistance A-like protein, partial [Lachnospiraceae bacterium]